ncbi:WD40 repeat-like protein, partial [Pluteus cervinus]
IVGILFSKNEKYLIIASAAKAIHIFNTETLEPICDPLVSRKEWINSIALSEDEHFLAATLQNASIQVWDFTVLIQEAQLGHRNVNGFACVEDGEMMFTHSSHTITLWKVQSKIKLDDFDIMSRNDITSISVSSTGKQLVVGVQYETLEVWDLTLKNGDLINKLHIWGVEALTCSSDGQHIMAGKSTGSITVWSMQACQPSFKEIQGHAKSIKQMALCRDKELVSRAADGTLRFWD